VGTLAAQFHSSIHDKSWRPAQRGQSLSRAREEAAMGSELVKALTENLTKLPGWLPLLLLCYAVFKYFENEKVGNINLREYKELLVPLTTLVLYVVADILDKPLWGKIVRRRKVKRLLAMPRRNCKRALSLPTRSGIYNVSMALAVAAKEYRFSGIWLKNEFGKMFRSLVLPGALIALLLIVCGKWWFAFAALLAAVAFYCLYAYLKLQHMINLYVLIHEDLRGRPNYMTRSVPGQFRLYFWDGDLVASRLLPVPRI
jgi:hypothetical protein